MKQKKQQRRVVMLAPLILRARRSVSEPGAVATGSVLITTQLESVTETRLPPLPVAYGYKTVDLRRGFL